MGIRSNKNMLSVGFWLICVSLGFFLLLSYKGTPGKSGIPPNLWPGDTALARNVDGYTLVMLAHPQCPCTQSSIENLAQLQNEYSRLMKSYVLFLLPDGKSTEWSDTALIREAEQIHDVKVLADREGKECKRFGVVTSGHALVFDRDGHMLFSGGITPARGHGGECRALDRLHALLDGEKAGTPSFFPVFGCPLEDSRVVCEEGARCHIPQ
jgi:hypothetical protein